MYFLAFLGDIGILNPIDSAKFMTFSFVCLFEGSTVGMIKKLASFFVLLTLIAVFIYLPL